MAPNTLSPSLPSNYPLPRSSGSRDPKSPAKNPKLIRYVEDNLEPGTTWYQECHGSYGRRTIVEVKEVRDVCGNVSCSRLLACRVLKCKHTCPRPRALYIHIPVVLQYLQIISRPILPSDTLTSTVRSPEIGINVIRVNDLLALGGLVRRRRRGLTAGRAGIPRRRAL